MRSRGIFVIIVCLVFLPTVFTLEKFCLTGSCCKNGQFLSKQTQCRPAKNECDLAEYCTGNLSSCPTDISIEWGKPCGDTKNPGRCVDGFCRTEAVKNKHAQCLQTCSEKHGDCSEAGECICREGWTSPPLCDVVQTNSKQTVNDVKGIPVKALNSIGNKRYRRSISNKHRHSNHHHSATNSRHKHVHKPIAQLRRFEAPPTEDTWTRYRKHPLFIPIAITMGGSVVLFIAGIWATALYRAEVKVRQLQERIKVEKSRHQVPRKVSMVQDPSVNIDVGR